MSVHEGLPIEILEGVEGRELGEGDGKNSKAYETVIIKLKRKVYGKFI